MNTEGSHAPAETELDHPVLHALQGPHRPFAETRGRATRYPASVAPFMAVPEDATDQDWEDLRQLAGTDPIVLVNMPTPPTSWTRLREIPLIQMTGEDVPGRIDPNLDIERLEAHDVPAMIELAARTKPGPFAERTNQLGAFYGIKDNGALVAMAGERMSTGAWVEVSAVCTDGAYRGRGIGRALMERVIDEIRDRGQEPFLHVAADNEGAIRLYEQMGFHRRGPATVTTVAPGVA